jgi:hypothetical protein
MESSGKPRHPLTRRLCVMLTLSALSGSTGRQINRSDSLCVRATVALVLMRACIFIHKWTKLLKGPRERRPQPHPPHSFSPPPKNLQVQATSGGKQFLLPLTRANGQQR